MKWVYYFFFLWFSFLFAYVFFGRLLVWFIILFRKIFKYFLFYLNLFCYFDGFFSIFFHNFLLWQNLETFWPAIVLWLLYCQFLFIVKIFFKSNVSFVKLWVWTFWNLANLIIKIQFFFLLLFRNFYKFINFKYFLFLRFFRTMTFWIIFRILFWRFNFISWRLLLLIGFGFFS